MSEVQLRVLDSRQRDSARATRLGARLKPNAKRFLDEGIESYLW